MTDETIARKLGQCQRAECDRPATHRSGFGNDHSLNLCVPHTNERENEGAWSRSLRQL